MKKPFRSRRFPFHSDRKRGYYQSQNIIDRIPQCSPAITEEKDGLSQSPPRSQRKINYEPLNTSLFSSSAASCSVRITARTPSQ